MTDDWRPRAACIGAPDTVMFPSRPAGDNRRIDLYGPARALCCSCPVVDPCLTEAMREESHAPSTDRHGMRGGHDPDERRKLARGDAAKARTNATTTTGDCGTTRGYRAHLRRGEQGCADCRRAAARERRAAERKRVAA